MVEKIFNGIKVNVAKDYTQMSKIAANLILKLIKRKKKSNLLVPTGTTPKGIYKILSKKSNKTFSNVEFFNMDEYVEKKTGTYSLLNPTDKRSYRYFMHKHLFDNVIVKHNFPSPENFKLPGSYDKFIKDSGGIDICLNALGENGHTLGFNFPGTLFNSKTRLVKIDSNTKKVNAKLTNTKIPDYALTTGLKTGMSAKKMIFLVSGRRKASILKKVIHGPVTKKIPATILRKHKNCTWIIDKEAASLL
jgi:glucosamine-6-phosphate deaminase